MNQESKGRSRPVPDAVKMKQSACKLEEALAVENECRPNLLSISSERNQWEVTIAARDGAVEILRFLNVWFDLPESVLFASVSFLDQFLAKLKVQEKYLSCLLTSCFYVAATLEGHNISQVQLVSLSQSKFTVKDMERMCDIIIIKLNLKLQPRPLTVLSFLQIYLDILESVAAQLGADHLVKQMFQRAELTKKLAVLIGDSSCAFIRPSLLALALIQSEIESFLSNENPDKSPYYSVEMLHFLTVVLELQRRCKINPVDFDMCHQNIKNVLNAYNAHQKSKHTQKLSWRFSSLLSSKMSFKNLRRLEPIFENKMF